MLTVISKVIHLKRVKNARTEYINAVFESQKIEQRMYFLIEQKKLLSTPVVRIKTIIKDRLEIIEEQILEHREDHKRAIDLVLWARDNYDEIQKTSAERMLKNPHLYVRKSRGKRKK